LAGQALFVIDKLKFHLTCPNESKT